MGRFLAMAAMGLVAFSGPAAAAEGEGPGRLTAFVCGVWPAKPRLDVQMMDDTPRESALRDAISAELKADGYSIASDATVRVTFDAEIRRTLDPIRQGYLGRVQANNREQEFQLHLWDNQGDSVIGGVQRPSGSTGPNVNHLTVYVQDKTTGQCLWRGEATHPMDGADEVAAVRRLLPFLLRYFGKTVPSTPFLAD